MNRFQVAQVGGMMKYEFKMHWRRRALWVITLTIVVITIVTALLSQGVMKSPMQLLADTVDESGLTSTETRTFTILFMSWTPVALLIAVILPIAVADTVAIDKHTGVRELLDSLPMSRRLYIAGKLGGMLAAVIVGTIGAGIVTAVGWAVFAGPYNVWAYLEAVILGGAVLVLLNGSLGVLIAASQPTRRRAILSIVIFFGLSFAFTGASFGLGGQHSAAAYINPLRAPFIMHYANPDTAQWHFFTPQIISATLVGMAELTVVGLLVLGWLHWSERGQ